MTLRTQIVSNLSQSMSLSIPKRASSCHHMKIEQWQVEDELFLM